MRASRQRRRGATEPVTRANSNDEKADESAYFLIQPDPRCPECAAIMDWRSAHRGIAITNGAKIRLSDDPWGSRHLHTRDVRVAHRKNRVGAAPPGIAEERTLAPGGIARSCSSQPARSDHATPTSGRMLHTACSSETGPPLAAP